MQKALALKGAFCDKRLPKATAAVGSSKGPAMFHVEFTVTTASVAECTEKTFVSIGDMRDFLRTRFPSKAYHVRGPFLMDDAWNLIGTLERPERKNCPILPNFESYRTLCLGKSRAA